jgi:hypothetical protein
MYAVEYVRGEVHTNGLENFWSFGAYVSVEPFHLFRYLDEQDFRYNNRNGLNDGERFDIAVRRIAGKRLTWNQLTPGRREKPKPRSKRQGRGQREQPPKTTRDN